MLGLIVSQVEDAEGKVSAAYESLDVDYIIRLSILNEDILR